MRTVIFILITMVLAHGCQQNNHSATTSTAPGVHRVIALEKINTSQYTYLLVNENGAEIWLAFPLSEVKTGETYYYANEMLMNNFVSKELGRTFEKIYFIQGVSSEPPSKEIGMQEKNVNPQPLQENTAHTGSAAVKTEKLQIRIEPAKTGLSIADLISKKEKFAGKKVTIKGKVAKFSPEIMGKNWVHIQDGSEYNGSYDLTITTLDKANVGETVTFEGTLSLNKDFGAGYQYDVLLENAVRK